LEIFSLPSCKKWFAVETRFHCIDAGCAKALTETTGSETMRRLSWRRVKKFVNWSDYWSEVTAICQLKWHFSHFASLQLTLGFTPRHRSVQIELQNQSIYDKFSRTKSAIAVLNSSNMFYINWMQLFLITYPACKNHAALPELTWRNLSSH